MRKRILTKRNKKLENDLSQRNLYFRILIPRGPANKQLRQKRRRNSPSPERPRKRSRKKRQQKIQSFRVLEKPDYTPKKDPQISARTAPRNEITIGLPCFEKKNRSSETHICYENDFQRVAFFSSTHSNWRGWRKMEMLRCFRTCWAYIWPQCFSSNRGPDQSNSQKVFVINPAPYFSTYFEFKQQYFLSNPIWLDEDRKFKFPAEKIIRFAKDKSKKEFLKELWRSLHEFILVTFFLTCSPLA